MKFLSVILVHVNMYNLQKMYCSAQLIMNALRNLYVNPFETFKKNNLFSDFKNLYYEAVLVQKKDIESHCKIRNIIK